MSAAATTGAAERRWQGGGLPGAVAAEWTKLWSVRSTWTCLLSALALVVAYTAIDSIARTSATTPVPEQVSAGDTTVIGVLFMAQFAILVLATLVICAEYSTGSIRTTLQCVPVRARVLLAKSIVLAPVLFLTGMLLGLAGMGLAMALGGDSLLPSTAGQVFGRALAIGGYLALTGVFVIGVGAAVRSVAGTVATAFLFSLVLPMVLQVSSVRVLVTVAQYLPGPAGMVLMESADFDAYGRPFALLLLAAWGAAALVTGVVLLRVRDA